MQRTLYISDLDGTLLLPDQTIPPEAVDTINRLIDRGLAFTCATARSFRSAGEITGGLHLRLPFITRNGTVLYDPVTRKPLEYCRFTAEQLALLRAKMQASPVRGMVTAYINGTEKASWLISGMSEGIRSFLADHRGDERLRAVQTLDELLAGEVTNLTLIAPLSQPQEVERLGRFYKTVKDLSDWNCLFQLDGYHPEYWLEISPAGGTKANAVQKLKRSLGFERVVVFGDSLNDLSMFAAADEAYAVANALPEAKQSATAVIGANTQCGVARWLQQHAVIDG